jgi:hypothetical protein
MQYFYQLNLKLKKTSEQKKKSEIKNQNQYIYYLELQKTVRLLRSHLNLEKLGSRPGTENCKRHTLT